jgi:hypothetical protein
MSSRYDVFSGAGFRGWTGLAGAAGAAAVGLALLAGCSDRATEPAALVPEDATITQVIPGQAGQGERVEIQILGSGFQPGDSLVWERNGDPAPAVVVEQVTYVSAGQMVATIRIEEDAPAVSYDIVVRERGRRRGIGTEIFDILHGRGSELTAVFRFDHDGDRTGAFRVDNTFILDPFHMFTVTGEWALTYYDYRYQEQTLIAQQPGGDGSADFIACWTPGGKVTGPGTRDLECWLDFGVTYDPPDYEASYTSWVGGNRPADGTGRITFTEVTPNRLVGEFSITMHQLEDWDGTGPTLVLRNGAFDIPVVSTYWDDDWGDPPDGGGGDEDDGEWETINGYQVRGLGGAASTAFDINSAGVVVGVSKQQPGSSHNHAVRWLLDDAGRGTGPLSLGTAPPPFDQAQTQAAWSVNEAGVIVGYLDHQSPGGWNRGGFVWDGAMRLLPVPEGATQFWHAYSINDAGIVAGSVELDLRDDDGVLIGRRVRAALWFPPYEDPPMLLPPLDGFDNSSAGAINNQGLIIGGSWGSSGSTWGRWQLEGQEVSGPVQLEGGIRPWIMSPMNNAGDIVGQSHREPEAALLRSGEVTLLGMFDGFSSAHGISDPGEDGSVWVVGAGGEYDPATGYSRAALWTVDADAAVSGPVDLGVGRAAAVNVHGWIVGVRPWGQSQQAALWRPGAGAGAAVSGFEVRRCRLHPRNPGRCH